MNDSRLVGAIFASAAAALLVGFLWGMPSQPAASPSSSLSYDCGGWDRTSLGKSFSMRARSCGEVKGSALLARGLVQVDEHWGRSFDSFDVHVTISRNGRVVVEESCDFYEEANAGTSGLSWGDEFLVCHARAALEPGEHRVKVDVVYDRNGDFGMGAETATGAEPVALLVD